MWASGNLVGHCCKVGERLDIAQIARTKTAFVWCDSCGCLTLEGSPWSTSFQESVCSVKWSLKASHHSPKRCAKVQGEITEGLSL